METDFNVRSFAKFDLPNLNPFGLLKYGRELRNRREIKTRRERKRGQRWSREDDFMDFCYLFI